MKGLRVAALGLVVGMCLSAAAPATLAGDLITDPKPLVAGPGGWLGEWLERVVGWFGWGDEEGGLRRVVAATGSCVDPGGAPVPCPPGGLPPLTVVTSPRLSVVRFHGRNAAGWSKRGASVAERFDYLYHPDELAPWVARVQELAVESEAVHVVFNNCVRNNAVVNAKDLAALLTESER